MAAAQPSWLNRNVAGMALTSLLADACYEMIIAVLPGFLTAIGVAAGALGWIEGVADATASFVKLGAGWYSDRLGHRKSIVAIGYFLTGTAMSVFALALAWPLVLAGRVVGWLGKGIRGPLRDAMLAESIDPQARGKAFGLHRAADTVGAVVGPLLGVGLLAALPAPSPSAPFRVVFVVSLLPGLASVAAFVLLVQESRKPHQRRLRFWGAMRDLPAAYRRFLRGVGLFGLGDFSHTLLILAAATLLAPAHGAVRAAQLAALLYVLRNVVYAAASYPIGALADRTEKPPLLAAGYGVGALTAFSAAALFLFRVSNLAALAGVFVVAGVYIAAEDALEGAIPADLVPPEKRGAAYGLMGAVNGFGDLGASVLVGTLWTAVSPAVSFSCAGALMLLGALLLVAGGPAPATAGYPPRSAPS